MAEWWSLTDFACRAPDSSRIMARTADGRALAHADFLVRVESWQAAFEAQAQSRTVWAIYLKDPFEFAAALLAAWHAGKTVALPGDDLPATVKALHEAGCALAGDLPDGLQPSAPSGTARRHAIDMGAARLNVYTSGSQGVPEAIDKRLDQLVSEIEALEGAFGGQLAGTEDLTVWATVSHQHIYGLLFLVLWPMAAGRPFAQQRLLYPADLAACLGCAPSVLVTTPAHLKRLDDHLDWQAAQQHLRAVFSSGAPLPYEASRSAGQILGRVPIEVFGSSETGGIAWRQSQSAHETWQPFADVKWRVDEGRLAVSSPRLPDSGWWTTSDRAEAAGSGSSDSFHLLGRVDRIVKIEGKRVSLGTIEQCLLATPWIREAKALVIETPVGMRVGVVAVLSDLGHEEVRRGHRVLSQLLRHALAQAVEAVALPRRWCFVEALPTNAQGKSPEALLTALFVARPVAGTTVPERQGLPAVQWDTCNETDAAASLDIHAGLPVFRGHFDVAPILPGVAQLDWALALGRQCFSLPDRFVRLEALKFVRPVQPGTQLRITLEFKPRLADATLCSLSFRLYSPGAGGAEPQDHASGRAIWSYEPEAVNA